MTHPPGRDDPPGAAPDRGRNLTRYSAETTHQGQHRTGGAESDPVLHRDDVHAQARPVHGGEDFQFRSLDVERQVVHVGDAQCCRDGVEWETAHIDLAAAPAVG